MATYNVYADESRLNNDRFMLIGGLWVPTEAEQSCRDNITKWRTAENMWREIKWTKISRSKLEEYKRFADIFFLDRTVAFNCIVIDTGIVDHAMYSQKDNELGFYKFYYQLLSRRVRAGHTYIIHTDELLTRQGNRLDDLKRCTNFWCANNTTPNFYPVRSVQACDSKHEDLMQMADVLLGTVGYRCNDRAESPAKVEFVKHLETRVGRTLSYPCPPYFTKFNVWCWKPKPKPLLQTVENRKPPDPYST